jgi:hypothetical protein
MPLIIILTLLIVLWAVPLMLGYLFWWGEHNEYHK